MSDIEALLRSLNEKQLFPRHGWACVGGSPDIAAIVLPFLGCAQEKRAKLSDKGVHDGDYASFSESYKNLKQRLCLLLKAVESWHKTLPAVPAGDEGRHAFLLNHLYQDACLYELACVFDSLPPLLIGEVRGCKRCCKSFWGFREWVLTNDGQANSYALQVFKAFQAPELEQVKQLRNIRTHRPSSFCSFVDTRTGTVSPQMVSQSGGGQVRTHGVGTAIRDGMAALFSLLERLTPRDCEKGYMGADVLGHDLVGYPSAWASGPWLEQVVPGLLPA